MEPNFVFTKKKEEKIGAYLVEMESLAHPLIPNDFKLKVGVICQTRHTSFRNGILERSWLHWLQTNIFT